MFLKDLLNALAITGFAAVLVALPLIPLFRARNLKASYKKLLFLNLALFATAIIVMVSFGGVLYAAEVNAPAQAGGSGGDYGLAFIAAALATGIGSIGAGLAVAAAAPAAIGALAEDPNTFGKAMIFVGLGEGLAIFGLLVSILILQKVP